MGTDENITAVPAKSIPDNYNCSVTCRSTPENYNCCIAGALIRIRTVPYLAGVPLRIISAVPGRGHS